MGALSALLLGCAGAARHEEMVVAAPVASNPTLDYFRNQIYVEEVVGGEKTNPMWTSEIDNKSP